MCFQYDYDDLVINYINSLIFSAYLTYHTLNFTIILTDNNDLTGSIPGEMCDYPYLLYDRDEVEGCPSPSSGVGDEFSSTNALLLFTCGVPLLVSWALF